MNIKTVFGDHDTAVAEISLNDLHALIADAKAYCSGNPAVDVAIIRIGGALIDNEITENISLSDWHQRFEEADTLDAVNEIAFELAESYIDNIRVLHHLSWEDAAYNRGAKTLAGLMRVASRRCVELI